MWHQLFNCNVMKLREYFLCAKKTDNRIFILGWTIPLNDKTSLCTATSIYVKFNYLRSQLKKKYIYINKSSCCAQLRMNPSSCGFFYFTTYIIMADFYLKSRYKQIGGLYQHYITKLNKSCNMQAPICHPVILEILLQYFFVCLFITHPEQHYDSKSYKL